MNYIEKLQNDHMQQIDHDSISEAQIDSMHVLHRRLVGGMAQWREYRSWLANFPSHARSSAAGVTTYVGKPSAGGQPTRSTQPFILSGSINE